MHRAAPIDVANVLYFPFSEATPGRRRLVTRPQRWLYEHLSMRRFALDSGLLQLSREAFKCSCEEQTDQTTRQRAQHDERGADVFQDYSPESPGYESAEE